ncbi:uncharacterized aarF domain-containing protein kinase 2-like [Antedon mediterranea]|uniref:uncharacterized aarF domain-containing protein kinase 2-like n=1 Tax=Antedon mediterranea TaxID=105859 RepID=UPI003AF68AD3
MLSTIHGTLIRTSIRFEFQQNVIRTLNKHHLTNLKSAVRCIRLLVPKPRPRYITLKQCFTLGSTCAILKCIHPMNHVECAKAISPLKEDIKQKRNIIERFFRSILFHVKLFFRLLNLICIFTPICCVYPLTYLSNDTWMLWLKILYYAVENLGPTLIKFGQWASTRRDLFPAEFCDMFSQLHLNVMPHSWYYTQKKLTLAFGKNWRDVIVKIDNRRQAVFSGCIGQVYQAYIKPEAIQDCSLRDEILDELDDTEQMDYFEGLEILGFGELVGTKDKELDKAEKERVERRQSAWKKEQIENGESSTALPKFDESEDDLEGLVPVAIKVLHPRVYRRVSRDLRLLHNAAWLCSFVPGLKWLSLPECVKEFEQLMKQQIDLRIEARNLERFCENFSDISCVKFPHPIRPYVRRDVMIMTYEEGEVISKFVTSADAPEGLKEHLAQLGIQSLLKMVFVDNFVHGDLHPGNILVQGSAGYCQEKEQLMLVDLCDTVVVNRKAVECPLKLVFLDVGLTSHLGGKDMENFKAVFREIILGRGNRVAELFLQHASENNCKDIQGFKDDMESLVASAHEQTLALGKVKVSNVLSSLFKILIRHQVKLESNFACIVLAIMVLEGLGRSLDPDLDILNAAKPYLLKSL